jgi:hypothetical protein
MKTSILLEIWASWTISLGIGQIAADEAAEQETWETRSSRG